MPQLFPFAVKEDLPLPAPFASSDEVPFGRASDTASGSGRRVAAAEGVCRGEVLKLASDPNDPPEFILYK